MEAAAPAAIVERLIRARIAISVAFFVLGAGTGVWAVHIPLVKARLGIDPAMLGLALLTLAIGAVIFMPVTGAVIARTGSRLPTAITSFAFPAILPLPIVAPSTPLFFGCCFLLGASMAALDVSMNTQASELEQARRKPTMSFFHGFYAVGGLAGAAAGAGIISIGWGNGVGALAATLFFFVISAVTVAWLLASAPPEKTGPRFALPSRAVVGLGLVAFLCFAIEGAVADWSALFLSSERGATPAMAATGFALFSAGMAILRLIGDPIVARLGPTLVLSGGGFIVAAGMAIALLAPSPVVIAIGFGLVGLGAANIVPVVFSAAGRTPGVAPSVGIAATVTLGYSGFLVAPPVLGLVAHATSLSVALVLVLVMALLIALGSLRLRVP
jgi:MFS family permease